VPDQLRHDGGKDSMKQINVWPLAIMLVVIILLVVWLRP
jgi:biopolymer transport protein ExbD